MSKQSGYAVAIQGVIRRAIHPDLALLRFKKSHSTYRRIVGQAVQILNVQSSAFNLGDARFTVNVNVDFPEARKMGTGLLRSAGPSWVCMASERIGMLMSPPHDHWWSVTPGESVDAVVAEVRDAVHRLALPWLTRHSDPREVLQEHGTGRHGIVLALLLGDMGLARRIAAEYVRRVPEDELAREWAREHGLLA